MIQVPAVRERCAGIDVGKKTLAVATIVGPADQDGVVTKREFGTTVSELISLKNWLTREACLSVAMESTGSYWIPVKNVLEESMEITLVCARKHKPKKGEKTDFQDAINLAHLHRHGMLKGSYLPERRIVELRDLTRRRKKLLSNLNAEKNRIQKVLEVANVKMGSVVSDVFGVSGQEMCRPDCRDGQETSTTEDSRVDRGSGRAQDERSSPVPYPAKHRSYRSPGSTIGGTGNQDRGMDKTVWEAVSTAADDSGRQDDDCGGNLG